MMSQGEDGAALGARAQRAGLLEQPGDLIGIPDQAPEQDVLPCLQEDTSIRQQPIRWQAPGLLL
jgi:hypothetical protein